VKKMDTPQQKFDLVMKPEERKDAHGVKYPWKNYTMAATLTSTATIRGSTSTAAYTNLAIMWIKKAVDSAKARQRFPETFMETTVPEGATSVFIPMRTKYMASGDWETTNEQIAVNTDVTWTDITTVNGISLAPTDGHDGVELTNKSVRTSAIGIIEFCREELEYRLADKLDTACSTALDDAAAMSTTVNGMQTIFGGDATDANSGLDAGDTLTTDMIAKARRLLMSDLGYYWNTNAWTQVTSAQITKNPWEPEASAPFVLYIAPEQEEVLMTDSQFVNASEYGGREVVLGGEIGSYLGTKVISTTKTPGLAAEDSFTHQGSTCSVDVASHTCFMVKAQKCGAIAWGLKPNVKVFDWPSGAKKRLVIDYSYAADSMYDDAIVKLAVTDA